MMSSSTCMCLCLQMEPEQMFCGCCVVGGQQAEGLVMTKVSQDLLDLVCISGELPACIIYMTLKHI